MSWGDHFIYDETSPSCLRWVRDVLCGRHLCIIQVSRGSPAGSESGKRYWHVMLELKDYRVHRVIWELHFGEIPKGMVVDHIDGDSKNNKVDNLRLVAQKVNCRNKKKQTTNTSGKTGVGFISNGKGKHYTTAFWRDSNLKHRQKCFSIEKLGIMKAFALAVAYREKQIKLLNEMGAGYSDRHGEELK